MQVHLIDNLFYQLGSQLRNVVFTVLHVQQSLIQEWV
jgi:hypothetical protein